ncbi:uncharacterized protein LOC130282143 isoform X3 [Hyla sarda]|uniref:uncharacterized protein LOC130282143 isoform X3 n=1 Tax=Hyla sarda TaxID=327740 RepID=UPI0024C31101|nr:uncharacterized protein LOC130282143 isoform X3 [Hyla sarda]
MTSRAKGRQQACEKKWDLRKLQRELQCGWDVREELEETKKSLERKLHAGHTPLTELQDETGHMRRGKEVVMGVVSDFYSNLYASKSSNPKAAKRFLSELFAENIWQNGEIRGIIAPGPDRYEAKCSLYMDDVTVFCADQRSVTALVQTCEDFGKASGAKVNCGKSEAMLFGEWHLASSAPFPFTVKPDFIPNSGSLVWQGRSGPQDLARQARKDEL